MKWISKHISSFKLSWDEYDQIMLSFLTTILSLISFFYFQRQQKKENANKILLSKLNINHLSKSLISLGHQKSLLLILIIKLEKPEQNNYKRIINVNFFLKKDHWWKLSFFYKTPIFLPRNKVPIWHIVLLIIITSLLYTIFLSTLYLLSIFL